MRRSCGRSAKASSTGWKFRATRSTFWRSRSSPVAPPKSGARTSCSRWCAQPGLIARYRVLILTLSSASCRRASARRVDAAAHICIATPSIAGFAGGGARALPPSPPGARFRTRRTTLSSRNPKVPSSARWTRTLRWRAWPATYSCWAPLHGAYAAWRRVECAWRMRTARRRGFPSGAVKRRAEPSSCRRKYLRCARRLRRAGSPPWNG